MAVKTREQLIADIEALFIQNGAFGITPGSVKDRLRDIIDSYLMGQDSAMDLSVGSVDVTPDGYKVDGVKVVGQQLPGINNMGTVYSTLAVDIVLQAALEELAGGIDGILNVLREHGLITILDKL